MKNRILFSFALSIFVITASGQAQANASLCQSLFAEHYGLKSFPIQRWLQWEQTPSIPSWKLSVQNSFILSQAVPSSEVEIEFAPDAGAELKKLLFDTTGQSTHWFSHPYNTVQTVPYFAKHHISEGPTLVAEHNASRTVTVEVDGNLYGLKLPTDQPFGPATEKQIPKSDMREDVLLARKRSQVVEEMDQQLGLDDSMTILRYAASVKDKLSGNGFVFRDLRPMQDGNYYLPAHQIPNIGRAVSTKHGADFETFWGKHWATLLGKIQAHTLLRYGIESEPTNPQNYLIQLDKDFFPTGKIFYRDITDSHFHGPTAIAIGLKKYVEFDEQNKIQIMQSLVGWKNSFSLTWHFDKNEAGFDHAITPRWRDLHIKAYMNEIVEALKLDPEIRWTVEALSNYLNSEPGVMAIKKYHADLIQKNRSEYLKHAS